MSVAASPRRRYLAAPSTSTATAAPWNSSLSPCSIPTPDGTGATIHPSVVDMGYQWHGYRWWMANTPYAGRDDDLENPCIYGSNDRRTWHVPSGLTNPLDPNPGDPWFHSDPELVFWPERQRLVVIYRRSATGEAIKFLAQSSADGVTWEQHGIIHQIGLPVYGSRASPAIVRVSATLWRMWLWANGETSMWTATNPLGPWTKVGVCGYEGWHGDVIWHGGRFITIYSTTGTSGIMSVSTSANGLSWTPAVQLMASSTGGGWDQQLYRPTILPAPESGYVDCWYSAFGPGGYAPGGCGVDYVRLPESVWQ